MPSYCSAQVFGLATCCSVHFYVAIRAPAESQWLKNRRIRAEEKVSITPRALFAASPSVFRIRKAAVTSFAEGLWLEKLYRGITVPRYSGFLDIIYPVHI
eukprot:gnl/TRDRNA2_/TRDRNA2_133065_c1_seq1.p2 gnl/TRDRNA2_/TRDRNA2_133065_c1~~gnl/TRDRNA2_/TRDRNA2_133065_c1_seq1.p2  ORF type:complete len:100 (-),score=6.01 gnl/TRDRNA2_/TRDRNA2_133065_c1_seq1:446-745(-)